MTNGRTDEQTNGGEIKGPFGFHPGPIIVYQSFFSIGTIAHLSINKQIAQIVPIQSSLCLVFWGFVHMEFLQSYHMMNNNPCLLLSFPIPLKGNSEWLRNYTLFVYKKTWLK